jgi:hypothetical protein
MVLPDRIEIQIVDDTGRPKFLANVLFGLKIFNDDGSWHNYSFFKTDVNGHISLTKQQIIDNTELKWENYIETSTPSKFELYVWDGQHLSSFIETLKQILRIYRDEPTLKKDLLTRGVEEEDLPGALRATMEKSREDQALFELIRRCCNNTIQVQNPKIEAVWLDSSPKQYEFRVSWKE